MILKQPMPTFLVYILNGDLGMGLEMGGIIVLLYVTATVTSDAQSFRRPVAVWFL